MSGTSSCTWVGCKPSRPRREIKSSKDARTSEFFPSPMSFGSPFIALLSGLKKPLAAGRMIAACRSLPTRICNFLRGPGNLPGNYRNLPKTSDLGQSCGKVHNCGKITAFTCLSYLTVPYCSTKIFVSVPPKKHRTTLIPPTQRYQRYDRLR